MTGKCEARVSYGVSEAIAAILKQYQIQAASAYRGLSCRAVQSGQDGGVSEAIAAAAAKAAELAAVAGLNNEHSNGKRETEGRHSEGQRSPGQRRRREEQPGAHEGTRKRRRRSSRLCHQLINKILCKGDPPLRGMSEEYLKWHAPIE